MRSWVFLRRGRGVVLVVAMLACALAAGLVWGAGLGRATGTAAAGSGLTRGNTRIADYMQANWNADIAGGIPYPARAPLLLLHGSWQQMGVQYGEGAGQYVRIVFDAEYGLWLRSGLDPAKLPALIDRYVEQTKKLSPEMLEFIKGIAKGAGPALASSRYADALSDFDKVFLLNSLFEIVIPPAWPLDAELMGADQRSVRHVADFSPFASHSWAASGSATPSGTTIAGGTRDQPWFPLFYTVAYVAIPSDPGANIVYGNTIAGFVAASAQVNDQGVYIGNTIIGDTWHPENGIREQDLGVPALIVTAYVSFFADSAQQAADDFTLGTEMYRRLTKRQTLAYTTGFNQLVADPTTSLVVERTAHRYAVRHPGDFGERGPYSVLTNFNLATWSYDAAGNRTNEPMTKFGTAGGEANIDRYYALFWEIANNLGHVDVGFGTDVLAKLKYYYTPTGDKVTEKNGIPVWRLGLTPERFLIPNPSDPNAFPTGGNLMYIVVDLASLDIYYTQGIPDHWSGPWDHVWLGDPAYRLIRPGG